MKHDSFGKEYPHLLEEWDYEANQGIDPNRFSSGSHQRVQWICGNGHTWQTAISKRCSGSGCPYCSGRLPIIGKNDLATTHPELANEWHPTHNGTLTPEQVTAGSGKKVWWMCHNGHEWQAYICNRALKGYGCKYCSNKEVVVGHNDLATACPELSKEWNYERNAGLTPQMFSAGSSKHVWWRCELGHEWYAQIKSRVAGCGCKYCTNQDVWVGYNDLQTTHPEIALEWNTERNGDLKPTQVTAGSTRQVWWKCAKGHEWLASVVSRSHMKSGCSICASESQTSFPEQALFYYLNKVTVALNRYREFGKEIDVYLPLQNVGIEYNGYWHNGKEHHDLAKVRLLQEKGIRIIVVREGNENRIDADCIEYIYNHIKKDSLNWVIEKLFSILGLSQVSVDVVRDTQEIYDQYIVSEKENSLAERFPDLIAEWHPTKNGNLTPWKVSYGSGKRVWWRCKHGHEWSALIYSRTKGNGCPYCCGKMIAVGENDLQTTHPALAKEWNILKNGDLTPRDVTFGSHKKVWWICKCGYEWEAVIAKRVQGQGCKRCAYQKRKVPNKQS